MRVLVTGGSGFLGTSFLPQLVQNGHEVWGLARSRTAAQKIRDFGVDVIVGDLRQWGALERALQQLGAEGLVNLASLGFGHGPRIVEEAVAAGVQRAVFVSSTAIFTSLPAASRRVRVEAEDAVSGSTLDWTVVRPTMIYGRPGDRNMSRLLRLLAWSPVLPLPGGGGRLQQPVHVDDLALGIVAALVAPAASKRAYDLAGPEPLTLRQVIEEAAEAVGRRPVLLPVPLRPAVAAVRAYERLASRPRIKSEQLERLAEDKAFDISAARTDLEYDPRSFAVGIAQEWGLLR